MKAVIILFALLGIGQARPQFGISQLFPVILRYDNNIEEKGFSYNVDTSNGIHQEAQGVLKNAGTPEESLDVKGSYSYVGDDGQTYSVEYTANEDGFQPAGAHLPPSAGVKKLGIPSSAIASLQGGGLG
ncbi:flexible cuticle protein 12-like [Anoplophora glabripennis]|uniref:flexible cuticle protein 12-like n=1 Tax=Anoplophora glabripennis TaxID=217634 RepID=UPI000873D201|nr:flexible cuticle protein 12-like [Anoplophora glabripennis]